MKKIVLSIIATILIMLQIFYYLMINAKVKFGYTANGGQLVQLDIGIQTFNYWEE